MAADVAAEAAADREADVAAQVAAVVAKAAEDAVAKADVDPADKAAVLVDSRVADAPSQLPQHRQLLQQTLPQQHPQR